MVLNSKKKPVRGISVTVRSAAGEQAAASDAEGRFRFTVPTEAVTLRIEGPYVVTQEKVIGPQDPTENLQIRVDYTIPPVHHNVVSVASWMDPSIERRNEAVYKDTLFSRDDQLFHTLDAGLNLGQHEGGGKSLEVRRFGFNLDHGGVSGGLKVLVDNLQQNQATQAHGQGYLGQLKSLSPELIQEVDILNGPFSAEYGDFSGLGVAHIRLKESLSDAITFRLQGGSFATGRTFLAYSPELRNGDAFLAYEGSYTNGPFLNHLRYRRDNLTGNYTWKLSDREAFGFKLNVGRNSFFSSSQLPLDEVAAGRLDRFGYIDPDGGGRVRNGTFAAYYRKEREGGDILKLDGFLSRSLFDLYSNFTFFREDRENGDGIQQHDSRLQQGFNVQYLRPYKLFGRWALLTAGSNFHANQIDVARFPRIRREPTGVAARAQADVTNTAGYVQQGIDGLQGRLHMDGGLRYDYFRFHIDDRVTPTLSGVQSAARFQPKANLAFTPWRRLPLAIHLNYGRGISSQDARGVVQRPFGAKVSTTDFYQAGASHHFRRFSLSTDAFLINRSNEQVYVPDDGSVDLRGPSRAYGFEIKSSLQITRYLAFNGGLTKVSNAFYRDTRPRLYVDSAPHVVSNAALTMASWYGFSGSLRFRYINHYRLDGRDPDIRASGLNVLDFSMVKRIRPWLDFNFAIDNLTNKRYYETQNYFESRIRPGDPVIARIHGTPGYPVGWTAGLTFHLFTKK